MAISPLYVGGGGPDESMLALNKESGDVVWQTGDERITHATPVVATILGRRQVIFFMQSGLVSLDAKDGNSRSGNSRLPLQCFDRHFASRVG